MTRADVEKNTAEKHQHNDEVMQKFYDNVQDNTVGTLNRKNIFDKGGKIKFQKKKFTMLLYLILELITIDIPLATSNNFCINLV